MQHAFLYKQLRNRSFQLHLEKPTKYLCFSVNKKYIYSPTEKVLLSNNQLLCCKMFSFSGEMFRLLLVKMFSFFDEIFSFFDEIFSFFGEIISFSGEMYSFSGEIISFAGEMFSLQVLKYIYSYSINFRQQHSSLKRTNIHPSTLFSSTCCI